MEFCFSLKNGKKIRKNIIITVVSDNLTHFASPRLSAPYELAYVSPFTNLSGDGTQSIRRHEGVIRGLSSWGYGMDIDTSTSSPSLRESFLRRKSFEMISIVSV